MKKIDDLEKEDLIIDDFSMVKNNVEIKKQNETKNHTQKKVTNG